MCRQWKRVCEYFRFNPDIEAIPLLLGSFGEVYIEEYNEFSYAVSRQNPEEVAPILLKALSPSNSVLVRRLAASACEYVPTKDPAFYESLLSFLEDTSEDEKVRDYCAFAFCNQAQNGRVDIEKYRKRIEAVLIGLEKENGGGYVDLKTERLRRILNKTDE